MIGFLALALFQQAAFQGATTPPSGDTLGYWQQRVGYTIVATLDEQRSVLHSRGTLVYVNNSPDTLREMYFHQYLNAFRPESKWSKVDEREHRVRFQYLGEPDFGYERFTTPPTVNGSAVVVDYPGAPDSTVAHFRLAAPLAPHDSIRIAFEWDARPSTVTRRQGRRGRTFDFAQWFPKVAVYDRGGWEPNALVPAGELYGEYGTYDVTMIVRDDQILVSSGVPVSGDPGWARVSSTGAPYLASKAYANLPPAPSADIPAGSRAVRFVARDVHHFAWSASPDYRYEGGVYVRAVPKRHFMTWDTVGVHVLFKPGDDTTWGGGRAVERTIFALKWLESIWGPYAYPQLSNVHRLDPGGTEFPMMIMDGTASQGLILHEAGHVFTYGILGNNEWRSGWLDEGLTDYQTDWAENLTAPEMNGLLLPPPRLPEGYRLNGVRLSARDSLYMGQWQLELSGRSQPIGTNSAEFSEFGIYNETIYDRAKLMYSQLRDVMGDSAFHAFMHDYYDEWALKHVDERAMRSAAERNLGRSLGWFFDQWIRGTGLMDYALGGVQVHTDGTRFETIAHVARRGGLRHPMPVGVHTASGWTIARADALTDEQDVHVFTAQQPDRIELDPNHVTWDWDRRNNIQSGFLISVREPRGAYNWPYLDQADRSHTIVALAPALWYSDPQGGVIGIRAKTSYLSSVDVHDGGVGFATRSPRAASGKQSNFLTRAQVWARAENLYIPGTARPLMNTGGAFNFLDGILKLDLFHTWDASPFVLTPGPEIKARVYATVVIPTDSLLLPEQWSNTNLAEFGGSGSFKTTVDADSQYMVFRGSFGAGVTTGAASAVNEATRGYVRAEGSVGSVASLAGQALQLRIRVYAASARHAPAQREIFAASQDPLQTFKNDLFRPRGALLKQNGVNYVPVGGAGLRGFSLDLPLDGVVSGNGELVQQLLTSSGKWGRGSLSLSAFGDAGFASSQLVHLPDAFLADAGAGLVAKGKLYDRNVYVRLDAPFFVNHSGFAGGGGLGGHGSIAPRWAITVGDIW